MPQAALQERRDQLIFAAVSEAEVRAFVDICHRKQRTTEFVAGDVLRQWIAEQRTGTQKGPRAADSEES